MTRARRPRSSGWASIIAARPASCAVLGLACALGACGPEPLPVAPPPPPAATGPEPEAAQVAEHDVPSPTAPAAPTAPSIDALLTGEAMMHHVRWLAAPERRGRGSASDDEAVAASYLADALDAAGVAAPAPDARFHRFQFRTRKKGPLRKSQNVCGWIPGNDPALAGEMVVLGAHYDHVGVDKGQIHPGAEDNASGTALVLQVATALATDRRALGRSVLVLFFGSEELGLIGSKAFVRKPTLPIKQMTAMINVDMIGRALVDSRLVRDGAERMGIHRASSVGVHGARGRPVLRRIVDESFAAEGVRVLAAEDFGEPLSSTIEKQTAGRTDHSTFEKAGVPALFFTSAESDEYHQPSDTADTLEPEVLAARARAIHRLVLELSRTPRADLGR